MNIESGKFYIIASIRFIKMKSIDIQMFHSKEEAKVEKVINNSFFLETNTSFNSIMQSYSDDDHASDLSHLN